MAEAMQYLLFLLAVSVASGGQTHSKSYFGVHKNMRPHLKDGNAAAFERYIRPRRYLLLDHDRYLRPVSSGNRDSFLPGPVGFRYRRQQSSISGPHTETEVLWQPALSRRRPPHASGWRRANGRMKPRYTMSSSLRSVGVTAHNADTGINGAMPKLNGVTSGQNGNQANPSSDTFNGQFLGDDEKMRRGMLGGTIVLPCLPPGTRLTAPTDSSPLNIIWTLPTGVVHTQRELSKAFNPRYYIYDSGALLIRKLTSYDPGLYRCTAIRSTRIEHETSITLTVDYGMPRIAEPATDYVPVESGGSVTIPCTTLGFPPPSLTWSTPDGNVIQTGSWNGRSQVLQSGELVLSDMHQSHSGIYVCQATNSAGVKKRIIRVQVISYPPSLNVPKSRQREVRLGGSIQISCSATGSPAPVIFWEFPSGDTIEMGEARFEAGKAKPRYAVQSTGSLELNRVTSADAGRYYCYAENLHGKDTSHVSLQVY